MTLGYVALLVVFGDALSKPFFRYVSGIHRLATAFLVGLIASTWLTYLAASCFASASTEPLLPANQLTVALMGAATALSLALGWLRGRRDSDRPVANIRPVPGSRDQLWDWAVVGLIGALVTWMMVSTFGYRDGVLAIGTHEWGDLGPNTQIAQSFALGNNFPTAYPTFAGVSIPFHFLFYFQVGNLTFLGLDPAAANNLLSTASLVAMLALVMALGRRLFSSAVIGRVAALLYFFHGAMSFVPYLASFASPAEALAGIGRLDHYLSSGFPYRGEEWGIWSQQLSLQQRHLASAIGIVLIVLLFLIDRLQQTNASRDSTSWSTPRAIRSIAGRWRSGPGGQILANLGQPGRIRTGLSDSALPGYVLCGVLLGLLPLWNGAIFIACGVVLAALFVLVPIRAQMVVLAAAATLPAIPQILFLRQPGLSGGAQFPTFHWGYVVDPPTLVNIAAYLLFIFGPKLLL
ncbi:MAG TPA: hypothetical protein VM347_14425, partial [Nonomuraea sp.]|nr:hypothetical protein [Nonomuraea sp.]